MNENSMDYVHLTADKLIGSYPWKGGLDLLNIVLIGIANQVLEHASSLKAVLTSLGVNLTEIDRIRE